MKNIIPLIFLLCICPSINSQNSTEIKHKLDSLAQVFKQYTIAKEQETASAITRITSEKWDPINFNPYKKETIKKPFYIHFSDSTYSSPIEGKKVITSRYGWRRGRPHNGIDIDLVTGDQVKSMFDGVVRFARYSSGHGRTVIVRHFNGLETAYAHLSKYTVKVNDTVKAGQNIGIGGTTGNARGSHLHLIVSYKGNYINPEYLFDFTEDNTIRNQNIWVTKKWVTAEFHTSKKQTNLEFLTTESMALASQAEENRKKIHVVRNGDTLSGISSKYHVSLTRLCKTNAIRKTSVLKIGQKLIVNI